MIFVCLSLLMSLLATCYAYAVAHSKSQPRCNVISNAMRLCDAHDTKRLAVLLLMHAASTCENVLWYCCINPEPGLPLSCAFSRLAWMGFRTEWIHEWKHDLKSNINIKVNRYMMTQIHHSCDEKCHKQSSNNATCRILLSECNNFVVVVMSNCTAWSASLLVGSRSFMRVS